MGKFKPSFMSPISDKEKQKFETAFENVYLANKEYFDQFSSDIVVTFNGTYIPLISYVTDNAGLQTVEHHQKINGLLIQALLSLSM